MDSQQHNGTRSQYRGIQRRARRGVSLIEVLVVLVILVVGILTIIRLFPSGFFSIQSTGNAGQADGLGHAAIDSGGQNAQNLPEAILPDDLAPGPYSDSLSNALDINVSAQYSNYDSDDPNNLENARVISNETVSVPTAVNSQSVYVVKYGPVVMPGDPATSNGVAALPTFFTVNSPNWSALSGNSTFVGTTTVPTDIPQDTLVPGQERFLVDLANKKIAVPYALYTPDGTTSMTSGTPVITVQNANPYAQKMVLTITCTDGSIYPVYLDVPAGTPRDKNSPYAPFGADNRTYLADVPGTTGMPGTGDYHGGWFDPTAEYLDSPSGTPPPNTKTWASVTLYRPYNGVVTGTDFTQNVLANNDPYQFKLTAGNFGTANPGAIGFNPKAAVGSGAQARKAKISYITTSWQILHEDYDIPALTGTGSTFVVRTSVPNLKLAGSANPDNSINTGIANSGKSLIILDLDTGLIVAPGGTPDPTNPDKPLNNEDLNGPVAGDPTVINISYALGRLTFGSDAFADNPNPAQSPAPGSGTAPAHRIRVFYTADLDWTVAVQKPSAYFSQVGTLSNPSETTPLAANQYVYDPSVPCVYVARCNAGKTFAIDGTYTPVGASSPQPFTQTVAAGLVLVSLGAPDVQIPLPAGSGFTFTAVRGLSVRSVVAWKERNQYKVHSVDAVLNRTP